MVADYRYYFGAIRSPGVIAEISMFGTYMEMELNKGGQFTGSFNLDQSGIDNDALLQATIPGFCFVMVERNGIVIWGGIVWSRTYQAQAKEVQLFAQSFDRYPQSQVVDADYDSGVTDQLNVFCNLWATMQARNGANVSVNVPPQTFPTTVLRQVTTLAVDKAKFNDLMDQIANGDNGFDWYVYCRRVPGSGVFQKDLIVGYPFLGNTLVSSATPVFEYPGNITNYYAVESMAEAGNNIFAVGSGDGSAMVTTTVTDNNAINILGWPRWDQVVSEKDVTNANRLINLANQELVNRKPPMLQIKATMKGGITGAGNAPPDFLSWGYLGDVVQVSIQDPRFPDSLQFQPRIAKWTLTPPLSTQVEEYAVFFSGDTSDL